MVQLTRKPKPDPEATFEAITSFAVAGKVYPAGLRLRGNHDAVRASFGHFMLADLPDDEKGKLRAHALWDRVVAEAPTQNQPAPDPVAQPPSGRFRAVGSYMLTDPDLQHRARINAGDIVDASDEVFRRYPHLFVPHIEER